MVYIDPTQTSVPAPAPGSTATPIQPVEPSISAPPAGGAGSPWDPKTQPQQYARWAQQYRKFNPGKAPPTNYVPRRRATAAPAPAPAAAPPATATSPAGPYAPVKSTPVFPQPVNATAAGQMQALTTMA